MDVVEYGVGVLYGFDYVVGVGFVFGVDYVCVFVYLV